MKRIIALLVMITSSCFSSRSEASYYEWIAAACISYYSQPISPEPAPSPSPTPTPGPVTVTCPNCNGSGKIGDGTVFVDCPVCDGKGKVTKETSENERLLTEYRKYAKDMQAYLERQKKAGCGCNGANCPTNCPCGVNCPAGADRPVVSQPKLISRAVPLQTASVARYYAPPTIPTVARLPGPSWENHDGDLASHLQRVHGVNTSGLTPSQLRTVHSNLHNTGRSGISRGFYSAPRLWTSGFRCPAGGCP